MNTTMQEERTLYAWHQDPPTFEVSPASISLRRDDADYGKQTSVQFKARVRGFLGTSGIRLQCGLPGCARFKTDGCCLIHGKSPHEWALKVKMVVELEKLEEWDEGAYSSLGVPARAPELNTPNARCVVVAWDSVVEDLAGFVKADLIELAREAMTTDATSMPVEKELVGKTFTGRGMLVDTWDDAAGKMGCAIMLTEVDE